MVTIDASLTNQYKFKYQIVFSARFNEQDEDKQVLDGTESYINLKNNHILTETDLDNNNVRFAMEEQIQIQEMKDSGRRFVEINSLTIYFYQTGEMNGSSYVKTPVRSTAILNFENMINIVSYGRYWPIFIL